MTTRSPPRPHSPLAWSIVTSLALVVVGGVCACREDAPPPPPEPAKCARFERDSDTRIDEVTCSGSDQDGDGVDDAVDLCPTTRESKNGSFDGDGCPDPDRDGDGLVDESDGCPGEAGPPPDGCPIADQDGDGIADHLDACPNAAEDLDGEDDSDGCPEGTFKQAEPESAAPVVVATIEMQRGRTVPTPRGARDLATLVDDTARDALVITRVRVVGRAGLNEAPRGRAKALAEGRAALARDAFLRAGLPVSRLVVEIEPLRGDRAEATGDTRVEVTGLATSSVGQRLEIVGGDAGVADVSTDAGARASEASSDDDWDHEALEP